MSGEKPEALSRYFPEIFYFARLTKAEAVYCFVVDGDRGTGGQPLLMGLDALKPEEYLRRNRAIIAFMRRSADLLEQELIRQGHKP
jgi:hypothetical protein